MALPPALKVAVMRVLGAAVEWREFQRNLSPTISPTWGAREAGALVESVDALFEHFDVEGVDPTDLKDAIKEASVGDKNTPRRAKKRRS